jgi:hypothetical protein
MNYRQLDFCTCEEITIMLLLIGFLTVSEAINKRIELKNKLIGTIYTN